MSNELSIFALRIKSSVFTFSLYPKYDAVQNKEQLKHIQLSWQNILYVYFVLA